MQSPSEAAAVVSGPAHGCVHDSEACLGTDCRRMRMAMNYAMQFWCLQFNCIEVKQACKMVLATWQHAGSTLGTNLARSSLLYLDHAGHSKAVPQKQPGGCTLPRRPGTPAVLFGRAMVLQGAWA